MADYIEAPEEVIDISEKLIEQYHPHLLDARIGFIMRVDKVKKQGQLVLGKARKVNAEQQMFMDLDFVIWLNSEFYNRCPAKIKRALIDHELCHCKYNPDEDNPASIVGHDIEEFNAILERYGFWLPEYSMTADAVQGRLDIGERTGKVVSLSSLDGVELPPEEEESVRKVMGKFEELGMTEEEALEMAQQFEELGPGDGIDDVTLRYQDAGGQAHEMELSEEVMDKMRSFKQSLAAAGGDVTLKSVVGGEVKEVTLTHEQLSEGE